MGVRMGVPEGKHAVEASDEARVAVMSCGLNRAGGGRPPLVMRIRNFRQNPPSRFFFSPMPLKFLLPFRIAALSASTALQ